MQIFNKRQLANQIKKNLKIRFFLPPPFHHQETITRRSNKDSVPYEMYSDVIEGSEHLAYTRVGNDFFIDWRSATKLTSLAHGGFYIEHPLRGLFHLYHQVRYTAVTLAAMQSVSFEEKNVLDVGAGNGWLGLYAAHLGARAVSFIEINESGYKQFDRLREINSSKFMSPSIPMRWLTTDIRRQEDLKDLNETNSPHIMVFNLGPHYGDSDLLAMELVKHLPNCKQIVAGGYYNSPASRFKPAQALEKLKQLGFKIIDEFQIDDSYDRPVYALTAERN